MMPTSPHFDFRDVAPRPDGLAQFIETLQKGDSVVCVCSGAVDYQLSPSDIRALVSKWGFVTIDNKERLCPVFVRPEVFRSRAAFEREQQRALERITTVHRVLKKAFPGYRLRTPLRKQPEPVLAHVVEGYLRLIYAGCLPATLEERRFGHLGMVLLMLQCCHSEEDLVRYLRQPSNFHLGSAEEEVRKKIRDKVGTSNYPRDDNAEVQAVESAPTVEEQVLGQVDLLRSLERADGPDKEAKIDAAHRKLLSLLRPSLDELDGRFESHFVFDKLRADAALSRAQELLGDDVDTSEADATE